MAKRKPKPIKSVLSRAVLDEFNRAERKAKHEFGRGERARKPARPPRIHIGRPRSSPNIVRGDRPRFFLGLSLEYQEHMRTTREMYAGLTIRELVEAAIDAKYGPPPNKVQVRRGRPRVYPEQGDVSNEEG